MQGWALSFRAVCFPAEACSQCLPCLEHSAPGLWVYGLPPEGFLEGPLGAALNFSSVSGIHVQASMLQALQVTCAFGKPQ